MSFFSLSQRRLKKEHYEALDPAPFKSIETLHAPCGCEQVFNPAWTHFKGKLVNAIRGGNMDATPDGSWIGIISHDPQTLEILESPHWLDLRGVYLPEDPRLFVYNDQLWLFFVARAKGALVKLFLCPLEEQNGRWEVARPPVQLVAEGMEVTRVEKNWTPLVRNGQLYFIYSFDPYIVLEANLETGFCKKVFEKPISHQWIFGQLRGGTQLIPDGDGQIGILHSSVRTERTTVCRRMKTYYFMGGFRIDKKGELEKISRAAIDLPDFYRPGSSGIIIFPCGLIERDSEGSSELVVSAGKNDRDFVVLRLDRQALSNHFVDV